jgi:hypothetical protein
MFHLESAALEAAITNRYNSCCIRFHTVENEFIALIFAHNYICMKEQTKDLCKKTVRLVI